MALTSQPLFDSNGKLTMMAGETAHFVVRYPEGTDASVWPHEFRVIDANGDNLFAPIAANAQGREVSWSVLGTTTIGLVQRSMRYELLRKVEGGASFPLRGAFQVLKGGGLVQGGGPAPSGLVDIESRGVVVFSMLGEQGDSAGRQLKRALDAEGRGEEMADATDASLLTFLQKLAGARRGLQPDVWVPVPSIYRLRLVGTGTIVLDAANAAGTVTLAVASYATSNEDVIKFPYLGADTVAVRATITGNLAAEII